jgi:dihydroxyacid dehydratase/phosphogluconate dehydratase
MRPTVMLFRILLGVSVEGSIRINPFDGVVLLGGCDKTNPRFDFSFLIGNSSNIIMMESH